MSVTLSKEELRRLLKLSGWVTLALFALFVFGRMSFANATLGVAFFQAATASITLSGFTLLIAVNLQWTRPWLAKLAGRPIVHGLWWGELDSIYEGRKLPPIQIAFVVRQTYLSLSIQSFTTGIDADSVIEIFAKNSKTTDVRLKYVYEMKREANAERKFTTGYGDLKLQDGGNVLNGFYWTNSPSSGRINLMLVQRDCDGINCFQSARRAHSSKGTDAVK